MEKVVGNPERVQDRAYDLYDTFNKYGVVMFRQQRRIYEELAEVTVGQSVLEAGCGNGVGSALIAMNRVNRPYSRFVATDVNPRNIEFAKCIYPWIDFRVWDITKPISNGSKFHAVICVECIEHVEDIMMALNNLLNAAMIDCWISTPNGNGKPQPPSNPYHVWEYTPTEMLQMFNALRPGKRVRIVHWEDFTQELPPDTLIDPLVYHITVKD